jgi:hypothetical protein
LQCLSAALQLRKLLWRRSTTTCSSTSSGNYVLVPSGGALLFHKLKLVTHSGDSQAQSIIVIVLFVALDESLSCDAA